MKSSENKIILPYSHFVASNALSPNGNALCGWVSGCSRNCKGCISPELQRKGREINVLRMLKKYEDFIRSTDCVALIQSGGEPLGGKDDVEQRRELVKLFMHYKEKREQAGLPVKIVLYTGYTYEEILQMDYGKEVLDNITVLIDGAYVQNLNDNKPFRGSCNQRFFFFTDDSKAWYEEYPLKIRRQQVLYSTELAKSFIVGIMPKKIGG